MHDLRRHGLVHYALKRGGSIHPITLPKELTPVSTSLDEYILFTLKPRSPSLIIDLEICPWTKPDLFA